MSFAKLYESEEFGQILALSDTDDEGSPSIFFYVEPPRMGVCRVGINWDDSDDGWPVRDSFFTNLTLEIAEGVARDVFGEAAKVTVHEKV